SSDGADDMKADQPPLAGPGIPSGFVRGILGTAGTNVLLAMIGLATSILAARLLGPAGRGELAAIQTWPAVVATVALLGLPDAVVYFTARRPDRGGSYLGSAMALALLASAPFMALGYLVMPLVLAAQSSEVVHAARWYLVIVPLFASVGMLSNA